MCIRDSLAAFLAGTTDSASESFSVGGGRLAGTMDSVSESAGAGGGGAFLAAAILGTTSVTGRVSLAGLGGGVGGLAIGCSAAGAARVGSVGDDVAPGCSAAEAA